MTVRALLLGAVLAVLVAAPAAAAPDQESTFQDDNELLYQPPEQVRANLDILQSLGVDRLRVTVLWKVLAPEPMSSSRPAGFDASDSEDYPRASFDRFDTLVVEAAARGLRVNFNVTGPSPLWANQPAPREDIIDTFEPSPSEFGQLVTALGKRYSGQFVRRDGARLPRVDYWSIWNEPNHSGWLTPQWSADAPSAFPRAASLYRALAAAAWNALSATGHGSDVILVGETAPKGDRSQGIKRYVEAMTFLRALYCVDERGSFLTGARGEELGCGASAADFRAANPALFDAAGYAHHPYELILSPSTAPGVNRPNWVTIANLSRLTTALDRIFRTYGVARQLPLYLTEYGYQTNPPDPLGVSFERQAEYLNQSEYIAWKNPRVKTLSQFLLVDDDLAIPASFQSGLLTRGDRSPKPAFDAYKLPIWLPSPRVRRGRSIPVWALVRPAANDQGVTATIEYRTRASDPWRAIRTVTSPSNYVNTTIKVRRSGELRVTSPTAGASRAAAVRILAPKKKRQRRRR